MPNYNATISGNTWTGIAITAGDGAKPEPTPKGLIVTRAVETKAGWVGQVIVDKDIVYESEAFLDDEDRRGSELSLAEVNSYVVDKVKRLFE